jgi:hypothetical protein
MCAFLFPSYGFSIYGFSAYGLSAYGFSAGVQFDPGSCGTVCLWMVPPRAAAINYIITIGLVVFLSRLPCTTGCGVGR